ncbi:hypothetical protein EJ06DRAFT_472442 [Trichodelitschia bisporula]|uniref:DUF8004 domain-containing protein n=1 Tax=Trichodelitschia bisporula TaxID=703511 RepID=A0A6G1I3U8_9PEZI|nr:hypothetical protein EJ06DRAFT_472442 [Trichodelitschia bisporula]
MLSDLQNVIDTYYELNDPSERWNSAQVLVQYLTQRGLDDVRGNVQAALGLLAWSEQPNVMWDAGYLEAFVHCVGIMSQRTMETREYKNLTQMTRHKLQHAYNAMQLKLLEAEERLSRFDFNEMWEMDGVAGDHPARRSFEAFRDFLYCFYASEYGSWPPAETDHQGHWLTYSLVQRLQADFGAMYDYLVDRNIRWDANEERPTRKWEMVCNRPGENFEADTPGLPLTNMLIGFDSSQKYDHIPHPYPLLPAGKSSGSKSASSKRNIFGIKRSKEAAATLDAKAQYQMALAYNTATNINRLGSSFEDNSLLDELGSYEKTTVLPPNITPADARLGRWILLYGILQVLSTISVDTAGLKYKAKVRYHLCPPLEGCPRWRSPEAAPLMIEACQQRSYCWRAPAAWARAQRGGGGVPENGEVLTPPAYENHQYERVAGMGPSPPTTTEGPANGTGVSAAPARTGPVRTQQRGFGRSPGAPPSPVVPPPVQRLPDVPVGGQGDVKGRLGLGFGPGVGNDGREGGSGGFF